MAQIKRNSCQKGKEFNKIVLSQHQVFLKGKASLKNQLLRLMNQLTKAEESYMNFFQQRFKQLFEEIHQWYKKQKKSYLKTLEGKVGLLVDLHNKYFKKINEEGL